MAMQSEGSSLGVIGTLISRLPWVAAVLRSSSIKSLPAGTEYTVRVWDGEHAIERADGVIGRGKDPLVKFPELSDLIWDLPVPQSDLGISLEYIDDFTIRRQFRLWGTAKGQKDVTVTAMVQVPDTVSYDDWEDFKTGYTKAYQAAWVD
jgi:hypothetical protein